MKKYFICKDRAGFLITVFFLTLRTVGAVGVAVLLNLVIDSAILAVSGNQMQPLLKNGIICGIYAVLLGLAVFLSDFFKGRKLKKILEGVKNDVMKGILRKSIPDYKRKNSGEYISVLNQNISVLEENYYKNAFSIYESVVGMVLATILLLKMNLVITVISMVFMAIPSFIPKLFGKRLGAIQAESTQKAAGYNTQIKDIFSGFEVIRSYHAEKHYYEANGEAVAQMEGSKFRLSLTMAQVYGLVNMASVAAQFSVMLIAGALAVKGYLTIGSIVAVTQLTGQVISPAFQLSAKFSQLKTTVPIRKEMEELIGNREESPFAKTKTGDSLEAALEFQDVTFRYRDEDVLNRVNLKFGKGKKYAIVGESGSGKSTLLKLAAGYFTDYQGFILTDGRKDKKVRTAFIQQDVFLFDDTIKNNITLYDDYTQEELEQAVYQAGLNSFVQALPEGLDTVVMENGSRFSGGEKQRIAIARALLHKCDILLLDEATSALDNENACFVEQQITSLEGITCISVTHRLSETLLKNYDEIIAMEKGKVRQKGSYEQMAAECRLSFS